MAGEVQGSSWALPKFYFSVDWGNMANIPFQEVSGLEVESAPLEYRKGNSSAFSGVVMPGIKKYGQVTLKKGVFANDNSFRDWYNKIKMNTIERQNVVVKLLGEGGEPIMIWTLTNAWAVKVTASDLKSDGNEVAVERIEIAHEGLTVTKD